MGGLVTRAYLLKNRNIAEKIAFAYFFSTPTTGSQIASILQWIAGSPQLSKMAIMKPEEYLGDLMRQWLAANFAFPSYCAYEKRPTNGIMLVVSMESAAAICTRALDPIDADHIEIVKPKDGNSPAYIAFKAAYADTKIPELKARLDAKLGAKLTSEIKEIAQFPENARQMTFKTLMEELVIDKVPQRLFDLLSQYNQDDIVQLKKDGTILANYRKDITYQVRENKLELALMKEIGEIVQVQLHQGWAMYLKYCILRLRNSKEEIKAMGNFFNFGITIDDAEKTCLTLQVDKSVHDEWAAMLITQGQLFNRAHDILANTK